MLLSLHIRNYILIDSLDISFPGGLVIITGQTGAGKSILLGALSLLTGEKADASVITGGADSCVVEAEFEIADDSLRGLLEESEVEWNGGRLIVRRVIHSSGRSRSFINDSPVNVSLLSTLSSRLVDIHSQHRSLMLTERSSQLSTLDKFARNSELLHICDKAWKSVRECERELADLESRRDNLLRERDYFQARYDRLEAAHLRVGELEELEAEQSLLANAGTIKESLCAVEELFVPSSGDDSCGIDSRLKDAARILSHCSRFMPELDDLSRRLDEARTELRDISEAVSDTNSRAYASPDRLQQVEERMSLLYDLEKKYGCTTVEELIAQRDSLSQTLYDSSELEERIESLRSSLSERTKDLEVAALELKKSRCEAAPRFAASVTESLRFLELERAVFEVALSPAEMSRDGSDAVCFRFASDGKSLSDVSRCASGGELSRIMLAIKALMASCTDMPTMVFDEIDTGVSGSVADKMGSMICRMGRDMQVFAITHLPQVAAKGDAHFKVFRESSGRMRSSIKKLSHEERVSEIAGMLSGAMVTDEALANARALLRESE